MTMPARRPKRNRGGGKLAGERAKAGVAATTSNTSSSGSSSGIHALDPEDGELFEVDPLEVTPNPMNRRLDLRGMDGPDGLVASVRRQGVHTPATVLHTKVFMENYPDWAEQVPHPERPYILGPGHRRHAAALEAGTRLPVILRDSWAKELRVEENLISENKDREDLSPIERALQLDLLRQRGMTSEEIAERSGYDSKGTVSRFLNLLNLPQEIQDAVHQGQLSHRAGYTLSTIRDGSGDNASEDAHRRQRQAYAWMREEGLSAEAAKNRLKLTQAPTFPTGNPARPDDAPATAIESLPNAGAAPGDNPVSPEKHPQLSALTTDRADNGILENETAGPAIPHQAGPEHGAATEAGSASVQEGGQTPDVPLLSPAALAAQARDQACRLLLAEERYAAAQELNAHLVTAVLCPDEWRQAAARAHSWLRELGKGPTIGRPSPYVAAVAATGDANLKRRLAFAIALAADEIRAAQPEREWDDRDRAHLNFLITSKAAYQPTEWEQEQLGLVSHGKQ
jgi:ParB family chromosome partitioning protein